MKYMGQFALIVGVALLTTFIGGFAGAALASFPAMLANMEIFSGPDPATIKYAACFGMFFGLIFGAFGMTVCIILSGIERIVKSSSSAISKKVSNAAPKMKSCENC